MERWPKVLLIDDEPDLVEMMKMALEGQFEVIVAYDGKEGVAKAKAEKPDAIVLDIMMPEKDGFTACREFKGDPQTASTPILILTGVAEYLAGPSIPRERDGDRGRGLYPQTRDPNELVRRVAAFLKK